MRASDFFDLGLNSLVSFAPSLKLMLVQCQACLYFQREISRPEGLYDSPSYLVDY